MKIRPAVRGEQFVLSAIARQSKAYWGYQEAQLDAWHDELTVNAEMIETCPIFVAEIEDKPVGFSMLTSEEGSSALGHLWVLPKAMQQGIGRALLDKVARRAAESGSRTLTIDSDPGAEPFYLACGARRVGEVAAPIDGEPDRERPQLVLDLDDRTRAGP